MNKFKVGDKVKVIDSGYVYSTNTYVIDYLAERKVPTNKWESGYIPEIGQEFQIDYIMDFNDDKIHKMFFNLGCSVAFISNDKKSLIIGVNGLEFVSERETRDFTLDEILLNRAKNRVPAWSIGFLVNWGNFVVAGNSLNRDKPNDFDVYLIDNEFNFGAIISNIEKLNNSHKVCETKNSLTVSVNNEIIQFCKYTKPSEMELIESFDFAHCQIAVSFECIEDDDGGYNASVNEVFYTDDWLKAKAMESTFYTGSEFPLSSLIRLVKYQSRGMFSGNSYKYEMLKVLNDVVKRGYYDYEDYKNQMDSVDLQLLKEENIGNIAWEFYKNMAETGLVRSLGKKAEDE